MGLGRALGAFFVLSRPRKYRDPSEWLPNGSRRVTEGLGRHPGGCGRHLKAFRVIWGPFWAKPAGMPSHPSGTGTLRGKVRAFSARHGPILAVFSAFWGLFYLFPGLSDSAELFFGSPLYSPVLKKKALEKKIDLFFFFFFDFFFEKKIEIFI